MSALARISLVGAVAAGVFVALHLQQDAEGPTADLTAWNEADRLDLAAMAVPPAAIPDVKTIERALTRIQREGNAFYRTDLRAANIDAWRTNGFTVKHAFQVLPYNTPASCSHTVAKKIELIRARLPYLDPKAAIFDSRGHGVPVSHTVVWVEHGDHLWLLGNASSYISAYAKGNKPQFLGRNLEVISLEEARQKYGG